MDTDATVLYIVWVGACLDPLGDTPHLLTKERKSRTGKQPEIVAKMQQTDISLEYKPVKTMS